MAKSPLTVHNAQLSTATVQVRTLTISGKQVTLAVFRQLKDEPIISGKGTLNGIPWGTVNYHPDRCGDQPDHWHVVWQKGDELRRCSVEKRQPLFVAKGWDVRLYCEKDVKDNLFDMSAEDLLNGYMSYLTLGSDHKPWNGFIYGWDGDVYGCEEKLGYRLEFDFDQSIAKAMMVYFYTKDIVPFHDKLPYNIQVGRVFGSDYRLVLEEVEMVGETLTKEEATEKYRNMALEYLKEYKTQSVNMSIFESYEYDAEVRRRTNDLKKSFHDLPQLFIAV